MAKKIRFPLEMENGIEVRTLEELKEHFSLEKVLTYYTNGKLSTWLHDRYHDEIAEQIDTLNSADFEFNKKICQLFDVDYNKIKDIDLAEVEERNRKIARLKEYTEDEDYIDKIDNIVFAQDDIYDLLDDNVTIIYLCGEKFTMPIGKKGITYIGINKPIVVVNSKKKVNWEENNIVLKGVCFDKKYNDIINDKHNDVEQEKTVHDSAVGKYSDKTYLSFMLNSIEREEAKKLFNIVNHEMSSLEYDINDDIKEMSKIIKNTGLYEMGTSYIERL